MIKIIGKGLTFADVLIPPNYSDITSRDEIDITTDFLGLRLNPIIAAPMDHVTSLPMITALASKKYYGIFHRFGDKDTLRKDIYYTAGIGYPNNFGVAIGVKDPTTIDWLHSLPPLHAVCVDVAHGDHTLVFSRIRELRDAFPNMHIIAGNIATAAGYRRLADAGADAVRVGIGNGSACSTRSTTGVGVPQLTAIMNVVEERERTIGPQIIADGGIESSGDIIKSLAAGADIVMLGKMLAGHDESPGEVITVEGKKFKPYRGQSMLGSNGIRNSPEGVAGLVPALGSVVDTLNQLEGWIKSGLSYVGARDLTSLRRNATFIKVSSATQQESSIRIIREMK